MMFSPFYNIFRDFSVKQLGKVLSRGLHLNFYCIIDFSKSQYFMLKKRFWQGFIEGEALYRGLLFGVQQMEIGLV